MKASDLASWLIAAYSTYGDYEVCVQSESTCTSDKRPCFRPISYIPNCIDVQDDQLIALGDIGNDHKIIALKCGIR